MLISSCKQKVLQSLSSLNNLILTQKKQDWRKKNDHKLTASQWFPNKLVRRAVNRFSGVESHMGSHIIEIYKAPPQAPAILG